MLERPGFITVSQAKLETALSTQATKSRQFGSTSMQNSAIDSVMEKLLDGRRSDVHQVLGQYTPGQTGSASH